ncbi:hypothetical protein RQP46_002444 [Phenoliferia psychrophenolica]
MTTLPLDVLLLILDCVYLDQSPAERQRSLAAVARSSRTLNALATSLLYSTPHLSTTRSAQKYARLFSYHASPWGVAGGRARWPKTITPTELVISPADRTIPCCDQSVCRCLVRCKLCGSASPHHHPLPILLFAALKVFDNLTSLIITTSSFDTEFIAHLLEEGAPLRNQIERLELVDVCDCDDAIAWIFWMYRHANWSEEHAIIVFDATGVPIDGLEPAILKLMKVDFDTWRYLWFWDSHDDVTEAQRWTDPFSSSLSFPHLRQLSIPAFHGFHFVSILFSRGHFPHLKHLTINRDPEYGEAEFEVNDLDLITMRRSVTRPHLDKFTPGPDGTILPSRDSQYDWSGVDPNVWVPLSYEELEKFEMESPAYRGPELELLDLTRIVVYLV